MHSKTGFSWFVKTSQDQGDAMQIHVPYVLRYQYQTQSSLLVYPPKCNGTYCECPCLRDYIEINSGL